MRNASEMKAQCVFDCSKLLYIFFSLNYSLNMWLQPHCITVSTNVQQQNISGSNGFAAQDGTEHLNVVKNHMELQTREVCVGAVVMTAVSNGLYLAVDLFWDFYKNYGREILKYLGGKMTAFLIFTEADRVVAKGWQSGEVLVTQI